MSGAQRTVLFVGGLILGALLTWVLMLAYLSVLDGVRGSLAVPLAVSVVAAVLVARRHRFRSLAVGLFAGAALETAFFVWLFAEFSRGLEGL